MSRLRTFSPIRLLSAFVSCLVLADTAAAEPKKDHCVILISLDGLAGFYLDDPKAELPTLRKLADEGARAEGMVCSFPTVTWPNHTTLVTGVKPGKHGVIGNSYLDRSTAESVGLILDPLFDMEQVVKVPTVFDVAHRAGLVTAGIIWPSTRNARTLDFTVPDMRSDEEWARYGTAGWLAELKAEGIPVDMHGTWFKDSAAGGPKRDWLYTRMAVQALERHSPNLLLLHLIEVDHVEHASGPQSPAAYWAVKYADDRLRDVVEAVKRSPMAERTTIIVTSDHGFFPIEREIRLNVKFKLEGLLADDTKSAMSVANGGGAMVYVLDDAKRAELVRQLREKIAGVEGVEAVFAPDDERARDLGLSIPKNDPRAPDLWVSARKGYSFADSREGTAVVVPRATKGGTHGYLPDQPDLLGTLVMWGHGVKPGAKLGKISNCDVAPTMAKLLGLELKNVDGRVLSEGLK
jgi:predicted AlkP superfamily pyrophosphatase or phosphodiesterase